MFCPVTTCSQVTLGGNVVVVEPTGQTQPGSQARKAPAGLPGGHWTAPGGSHCSGGLIMPLPQFPPPPMVVLVVEVIVVVELELGSSTTASDTNASTFASSVTRSFDVAQPPRDSASAIDWVKRCSARARQL